MKRRYELMNQMEEDGEESIVLPPRPLKQEAISTLGFSIGGIIPMLAGAFIHQQLIRIGVVAGVTSIALILSGIGASRMGRLPVLGSTLRVLILSWLAMGASYGFTFFINE
ncbi:hypothetical protein NE237_028096 [Protea cynaroides]|uniref:Vacuolar iron transporter n=1 Tax=Protea cynaroides TaxID=273540 RepID=A0A9Q0GT50_9MAGN|nr:hypothetical protein NE237_028096 [Protea cynaroides]